jgi:hypothetical protein
MSPRRSVINFIWDTDNGESPNSERSHTWHVEGVLQNCMEKLYRCWRSKMVQVSSHRFSILLRPLNEVFISPIALVYILDVSSRRQKHVQMLKITPTLSTCDGELYFSWVGNCIGVTWLISLRRGEWSKSTMCIRNFNLRRSQVNK